MTASRSFARLLALAVLAGAATGCKTEKYEIVERPDPETGEIKRYWKKTGGVEGDPAEWERLRKLEEEERLRNETNGKKELLPPPGKRVVYRQPATWDFSYKRPKQSGSIGH